MAKLKASQIQTALAKVPAWKKKADTISRRFEFKDFPAAIKFVNKLAPIAEKANHHPDIDIRWRTVTLAVNTHDQGGAITAKDHRLAESVDALL